MTGLHLTYPDIHKLRLVAVAEMRDKPISALRDLKVNAVAAASCHQFIDRMNVVVPTSDLSSSWNDRPHVPHRIDLDIAKPIKEKIVHHDLREDFCSKHDLLMGNDESVTWKPGCKSYKEQTYVLTRLISRNELDLFGTKVYEKPKEIYCNNEPIMATTWIESRECWNCERWNYFIPSVTRNEISDAYYGEFQETLCLTDIQENAFKKVVQVNQEDYDNMELMVPYIVGTLTDFKFKQMVSFVDYMLDIDPCGEDVRNKHDDNTDKMKTHYLQCWKAIVFQKDAN